MRFVSAALCLVLLSSCHFFAGQRIAGNGHITTMDKNTGSFNNVEVSGSVTVRVRQDATPSVRIETDENLMQYVEVSTRGNTLVIRTREGFHLDPSKDLTAYVTAPSFSDISVSGACDIMGDSPLSGNEPLSMHLSGDGNIKMQVDLPKVSTEISGSGSVTLTGQAHDFRAQVGGSGDIKCFDLTTENTRLDLSGAASAEVNASKRLEVEVSGEGSVRYKGNPNVSQSISGSGSVKKAD